MSSDAIDLEQRVAALEGALALPSAGTQVSSAEAALLKQKVAALEKQLNRTNYRIEHLVRGLEHYRDRAEAAETKLKQ